eukprot:TRINITY_DN12300_c0_g2_i1.p1 TRINITY_DN12300_c0_g2~~TRINITY_DN12300_c0_g2_i1.p1  ORF type:complete len:369 (-),score=59.17 TRINITY_DN12300_c0_g2_i1:49-1155(-)
MSSSTELHEEAVHFCEVYHAFAQYGKAGISSIHHRQVDVERISPSHRQLLESVAGYPQRLKEARKAVLRNHAFIRDVLESASAFFNDEIERVLKNDKIFVSETNADKVRSTIRQCMRDWTDEGKTERNECYSVVLECLEAHFPDVEKRAGVRVLTPGAGLGRLSWEIARRGFESQGNEFSYFMLITSNFILNGMDPSQKYTICPFVHQSNNLVLGSDQLREVEIPDIHPSDLPENSNFSMTAGEFMEVYHEDDGQWDVIVTAFFLDTAKNVLQYMETFSRLLKPGGLWINLGPLLYHYSDSAGEVSIELSYDEIRKLMSHFQFNPIHEDIGKRCHYTYNNRSMLDMCYNCVFFTCRKELPRAPTLGNE